MERPCFDSREAYGARFTDAAFWRPYVEAVCERHDLAPCRTIRAGLPGTHPAFVAEGRFVVKFFTHLFHGAEGYAVEADLYRLLADAPAIPAPSLIAAGDLFPPQEGWPWPYIVSSLIPGRSLGEVREGVAPEDLLDLAAYLGRVLRAVHALPAERSLHFVRAWEPFLAFLAQQRAACAQNHRRWGSLPDRLVGQIDGYLPPADELVARDDGPHLVHCDLNEDHVLGEFHERRWRPAGIIDFGDARVGDRLYDLVALHLGLFHGDKRLLRACLEAYGADDGLMRRLSRRAMSYTLLHEFDVLERLLERYPTAAAIISLEELGERLWDIGRPGFEAA